MTDYNKITIANESTVTGDVRFANRTSDPSVPLQGDIWYNSTSGELKYFDGSVKILTTDIDLDTLFDATVGAGGDYSTVEAAITAGKVRIHVISAVLETADWTLVADTLIWAEPGVDIGMDIYQINGSATITFTGGGIISYNYSISQNVVTSSQVIMENFNIINSSTIGSTEFCASGEGQTYRKIVMTQPNFASSGIVIGAPNGRVDNAIFVGGGTSCTRPLVLSSQGIASAITVQGTFNPALSLVVIGSGAVVTGLISNLTAGGGIHAVQGTLIGHRDIGAVSVDVFVTATGAQISDGTINGLLNIASAGTNCVISNVTVNDTVTAQAIGCSFVNLNVNANMTISASDNTLTGGWIGSSPSVGGGANLLTISGGSRTLIVGVRTDNAIVDSGTDTVIIGNVVY